MTIRTSLLLSSLAIAISAMTTMASPAATTKGIYRNWKGEIDEVTVVQPFRADSYRDIIVEPLDNTGLHLPNLGTKQNEEVRSALKAIKPSFLDGLRNNLRNRNAAAPRTAAQAFVIRTYLVAIDPGSENKRYFLGFGAGAVKISLRGEIFESQSHRTLVRFQQERRSAVGSFGGTGFSELCARTARQIGADVAALINAF